MSADSGRFTGDTAIALASDDAEPHLLSRRLLRLSRLVDPTFQQFPALRLLDDAALTIITPNLEQGSRLDTELQRASSACFMREHLGTLLSISLLTPRNTSSHRARRATIHAFFVPGSVVPRSQNRLPPLGRSLS